MAVDSCLTDSISKPSLTAGRAEAGEVVQHAAAPSGRGGRAALEAILGWSRLVLGSAGGAVAVKVPGSFQLEHQRLPRRKGDEADPLLPGEQKLGRWCRTQRQRWKGSRQPPLLAEQQAALEAIPGWSWELRQVKPWEVRFQEVVTFQPEHQRLPRWSDGELGRWCGSQRQWQKGTQQPPLPAEQKAALEAIIPGWHWDEEKPWEVRCQELAAFHREHGRLPRQTGGNPSLPEERELGRWSDRQWERLKGSKQPPLSAEQRADLMAIPGFGLW